MKRLAWILWAAFLLPVACSHPKDLTLEDGAGWTSRRSYADFVITGQARTEEGAAAAIRFCESGPGTGYEVLLQNGPIDGTVRTGSLTHVRNLYRSLAKDGEWFDFSVAVRGKNIGVQVNGVDVVCYTEPAAPWRSGEHAGQRIAPGRISFAGLKGKVEVRGLDIDNPATDRIGRSGWTVYDRPEVSEEMARLLQDPQAEYCFEAGWWMESEFQSVFGTSYQKFKPSHPRPGYVCVVVRKGAQRDPETAWDAAGDREYRWDFPLYRAIGNLFSITVSAAQHRKLKIKKEIFGEPDPDITLEQVLARL